MASGDDLDESPPSQTITVTDQAAITIPPNNVVANQQFGLTVEAQDADGDVDTGFDGNVTVSLQNNPTGATLGGTLTVPAKDGVATFDDLTIDQWASGYTLQVSGTTLAQATTDPFEAYPTVVVVTPGFKPLPNSLLSQQDFLLPFNQLADDLQNIPATGSVLDGAMGSYVTQWDSSASFRTGFTFMMLSIVAQAESDLASSAGDVVTATILGGEASLFETVAASTAQESDQILFTAARTTADDLMKSGGLLSSASSSDDSQVIELVGHSRGAEFNAVLANILKGFGYDNVADYTALDGYSSDWSAQFPGSGVLSQWSIPQLLQNVPISGTEFNFIAGQGLQDDTNVLLATPALAAGLSAANTLFGNVLPGNYIYPVGVIPLMQSEPDIRAHQSSWLRQYVDPQYDPHQHHTSFRSGHCGVQRRRHGARQCHERFRGRRLPVSAS